MPEADRCCLQYLWVNKDGHSLCWAYNRGKECPHGRHIVDPPKSVMQTKLYARLKDQHGKHNVPKKGPKPPNKLKDE